MPGLVLAATLADWSVALIERRTSRATWLEEAVARLTGSTRSTTSMARSVRVVGGDVYDWARTGGCGGLRESATIVTARAFGRPGVTAELGGALVEMGGFLVVSEPPEDEGRWGEVDLGGLGLTEYGSRVVDGFRFQVLSRFGPLADHYPRRRPG